MDKSLALNEITDAIEPILDALESSAYKDGQEDSRTENEKAVAQAREDGYDEGYREGFAAGKEEAGTIARKICSKQASGR